MPFASQMRHFINQCLAAELRATVTDCLVAPHAMKASQIVQLSEHEASRDRHINSLAGGNLLELFGAGFSKVAPSCAEARVPPAQEAKERNYNDII